MSRDINIAVIYPNKSSSSETFIQDHLNGLPAKVHGLYGGWFPTQTPNGPLVDSLVPPSIFRRILNKFFLKPKTTSKESIRNLALKNYFIENNIRAVMAEYALTAIEIMNVCEESNIPLTVHFHGFDAFHSDTVKNNKDKYDILFEKAAAIVVVSNDMKEQLVKLGAKSDKIVVNSCGVDTEKFKLRKEKPQNFNFLFAGRFVNKKAPHLTIMAFYKVYQKVPTAKLIMMGDGGLGSSGELFEGCKQLVKALKIENSVIFTGAYKPGELISLLPNIFCFLQHSVRSSSGDSEGTPVTLLEACSTGLPVVATKHGGIKDVVLPNQTGFLVDEYDIENTAECMLKLIDNPDMAYDMGIMGRKRVEEYYSMNKSINNLWETINNTIIKD